MFFALYYIRDPPGANYSFESSLFVPDGALAPWCLHIMWLLTWGMCHGCHFPAGMLLAKGLGHVCEVVKHFHTGL